MQTSTSYLFTLPFCLCRMEAAKIFQRVKNILIFSTLQLSLVECRGKSRDRPMRQDSKSNFGIKMLLKVYKGIFHIPENLNHYSKGDYREAERKFLKYALEQRMIETQEELFIE